MAILISDVNKRKLEQLSQAAGTSQNDIINLLIAAVAEIELKEMQTERPRIEKIRPRSVIPPRRRWEIRP